MGIHHHPRVSLGRGLVLELGSGGYIIIVQELLKQQVGGPGISISGSSTTFFVAPSNSASRIVALQQTWSWSSDHNVWA